jgi:signal transduction histidine kinase
MELSKVFLTNISLLITYAYLMNLFYKLFIYKLPRGTRQLVTALLFIVAGWLTMYFGLQLGGARYDLRYVPLILGIVVFPSPSSLLMIGVSIGVLRLTFGADAAGWAGFVNLTLLGVLAAYLSHWLHRKNYWSVSGKAVVAVLSVNLLNVVNIAVFGIIPMSQYLTGIAPLSFTVSVFASFVFLFIIHDFQLEQTHVQQLSITNRLLRVRTQDLNQAKHELQEKADQLETASRYKSEFLANMSHELKTPLNSILLLSQMQGETATGQEELLRYAELIHTSGQDLLVLVNDILDLSKVEAGKLDIAEEQVYLDNVLDSMDEQFRPLADRSSLVFTTEKSANAPQSIRTDPFRLNQILRNLLVNAFKFTDKGSVQLILSAETGPAGAAEAKFVVADTGIGIDPDKKETIFESFRQEDGSVNRKYGGSGLGLTISRQLAELLGGRLEVETEKGVGSRFTLTLPVHNERPCR